MSNNLGFSKGMEDGRLKLGSEAADSAIRVFPPRPEDRGEIASRIGAKHGPFTGTSLAPGEASFIIFISQFVVQCCR
jgi:hypothetical protein